MSKKDDKSFADKYSELEEILRWFEEDSTDIDAALTKFERGMHLSSDLKKHLDVVENKVQKIKAQFND